MIEQQKLITQLMGRVDFLMNQFTHLEPAMVKILEEMASHPQGEVSLKEKFRMYTTLLKLYNDSAELIRKLMVYFPPVEEKEERDMLLKFRALSQENKRQLLDGLESLLNGATPKEAK